MELTLIKNASNAPLSAPCKHPRCAAMVPPAVSSVTTMAITGEKKLSGWGIGPTSHHAMDAADASPVLNADSKPENQRRCMAAQSFSRLGTHVNARREHQAYYCFQQLLDHRPRDDELISQIDRANAQQNLGSGLPLIMCFKDVSKCILMPFFKRFDFYFFKCLQELPSSE